ncbi:MAG: AAA family ATPase [Candidatus Binataceae bacterium]
MAIIAITQQIGSRGNDIAAIAAKELGYRLLLGKDLASFASSRYNVSPEQLLVLDERKPHFWERLTTDTESFLAFFRATALREMAADKVVMVGRSTAHHLPESGCGLRVHVIGDFAERVERVATEEKLSRPAAEKRVRDYDRELRSRVQTIVGVDLEDPALYAVVLNASRMSVEAAASVLVLAARDIETRATGEDWQRIRDAALAAQVNAAIHAHPQLNHAQIRIQCDKGRVRVNGPGLVPPWDDLANQVVRQVEGVAAVEILADAPPMVVRPE